MSIDFDSGALQTQQEDDDDEYDKEDYAREQELQQLLTDLPHDMLDDSLCSSSDHNYSDCSDHELSEQNHQWNPETHWGDNEGITEPQNYKKGYTNKPFSAQYMEQQNGLPMNQGIGENISNGWGSINGDSGNKEENIFTNKYTYNKEHTNEESNVGNFHTDYDEADHCSTSKMYHLPDDFKPYTNGERQLVKSFPEEKHNKFQLYMGSEGNDHQPTEAIQIKYNPYQLNIVRNDVTQEPARDGNYDDLQREFLDTGECTSSNMQFVQLQVLYKAKGRQLEDLNAKLEESERQLRYFNHQLAIVKDEKDGLAISLQESQMLLQNSREIELQLRGQIAALQKNVDGLTSNDEQLRKEIKVSKLAMDSMQQQIMDLRRSDSIHRAREQHEAVVSMLKQKNEEQVLQLQQKLDDVNTALQQQKEMCSRLEEQVKQAERKQEETKLEKTEVINRLSRSLEESQKQCANLLHTDSLQEATKLQCQLQQIQSSKMISDGMNKALQEEVNELKQQITMYESAAKFGVFINGEGQEELSDSYVDLGIKKVNWQKSRFHRTMHTNGVRKDLSSDEIVMELKTEFERCLSSNKMKRQQIVQLQSDLRAYQSKTEELKKLLESAEKAAKDCKGRAGLSEHHLDSSSPYMPMIAVDKEIERLQVEKQQLQQEVEKHLLRIKELAANEEKLKATNQQLCSEMRKMLEDFDNDKKESIERCERIYEQYHEDIKKHLQTELSEKFETEKEQLCHTYEEKLAQLQSHIHEMNDEMTAVQECYIAVCKEKDTLEDNVRDSMRKEFQLNEEKWRATSLEDKEKSLQALELELEGKHQLAMSEAKAQWQREREDEMTKQFGVQLALAKDDWIKEHQQVTELTIQDIEKEWKHKLDTAIKNAKVKSMQSLEEHAVQTEETSFTQNMLEAVHLDELKVQLHNTVQDKERAVREVQMEVKLQREELSSQVELALTKARSQWLQELTSLSEYKAHLRLEKEKWEKLNDGNIKKQISNAVSAAEEKWKQGTENVGYNIKQKEFEEQIVSLKRELDLKNEEFEVQMKVELCKARAQWNKERQEEIQHIQEQNENDYRLFLEEHRTKVSDALSTAKVDFEKQKNELISQKETEMTERLNQVLKQRTSEESRRIHDHENKILSEIEHIMSDIHDELIENIVMENHQSCTSKDLNVHFLERLRSCLHKSMKGIAYKLISNAKQEWKQSQEGKQETLCLRPSLSGHERSGFRNKENSPLTLIDSEKLTNGFVKNAASQMNKKNDSPLFCCCENCQQQLAKLNKECRELRSKLDKACRHLQQAVKNQKLKSEQFGELETIVQNLKRENTELKKKLDKITTTNTEESFPPEEGSEKGCSLCRGKALEEMRAQYIKAVDKIKNDMFQYIHESKGRAAEMLKTEVLRERQETARKMRKYYLTCLQQLLRDDGKNEGAEKKIMNAASKLATMAKVLETPISQKTQSRNLRPASKPSKEEAETNKALKNGKTHASAIPAESNIDQKALEELIRKHMKEKLDDRINGSDSVPINKHNVIKQLRMDRADQRTALAGQSAASPLQQGSDSAESMQMTFGNQGEPSFLHGLKDYHCHERPTARSDSQVFELQETPVRDENGSNDWSCAGGIGLFPTQTVQNSLTSIKAQALIPSAPGNFSAAGLFSFVEGGHDTFGSKFEGQNLSAQIVKRREQTLGTQHYSKPINHPPPAVNLKPYSDSKSSQLPSRKLLLDFASPQQDSGFDSPLPNVNTFN